jgi:thiamine transport system substrate-binding protein
MVRVLLATILAVSAILPARAADTLTVLTYESFTAEWGPGPPIEKAFEVQCGCDLKWIAVGDGVAILNRLKLEGDTPSADLALGLDNNLIAEARQSGLFAPHGQKLDGLKLPTAWTDDTFLPYDYAHFAVVYDREKLPRPPRSLAELVDTYPENKIVIEDPRTSTPGLGFLIWVKAVYGDKAGEAWSKLKHRVLTVTPGWSEAYALFTKGEAPMVVSYTTSPAYHQIAERSERYAALSFPEGHPMQVEVAAKLAKASKPALADTFLAFMLSPGFQDQIPTGNWMLPVAATSRALPAEFDRLVKPVRTLDIAPEVVAANRRAWTDEWLAAMGR